MTRAPFRPRISKCGYHWNVEYYQGGTQPPMNMCLASWKDCLTIALGWMKKYPPAPPIKLEGDSAHQ